MLHAVSELGEDVLVDVLRSLRDEEDPDSLRPDQTHRLGHRLEKGLRRVVEQEVRFVEEEDQLRLLEVADLRERLEQLGEEPHERSREEPRLVLHGRELEAGDHAASIGCRSQQVVDVELRLTEELVAAAVLQPGERSQQDPDRLRGDTADAGELRLAGIRDRGRSGALAGRKDRGAARPFVSA